MYDDEVQLKLRESPARRFANRHDLTERRSRVLLMIQELLDDNQETFKSLMDMDPKLLRQAYGRDPEPTDAERYRPFQIGKAGLLAYPGAYLPEWEYSPEEELELIQFTRFLVLTGSGDAPFYLHATLDNFGDVVWDWRDIRAIRDDIFMASLLVLKFTVMQLISEEIPWSVSVAKLGETGFSKEAWEDGSEGYPFGRGSNEDPWVKWRDVLR